MTEQPPRLFNLVRDEDATGISGTGLVAWGVEFPDGPCVLRWCSALRSTAVYASLADVVAIHGHDGKTRVVASSSLLIEDGFDAALDRQTDYEMGKFVGTPDNSPYWRALRQRTKAKARLALRAAVGGQPCVHWFVMAGAGGIICEKCGTPRAAIGEQP